MKKVTLLCFLLGIVIVACKNHNNTKSSHSDDPEYRAVEDYLVREYECDSILEYCQGDSIFTTIFNCSEYGRLCKEKRKLEEEASDEQFSADSYSSNSEKDEYLHHKHSSNAKYIRRKIYDIDEEIDKLRDNFVPEYKGKSVYVRFKRTLGDTVFCEVHLTPYSSVIEEDGIIPLREYGEPYKDEKTGKFGLKEVHTKRIILPAKYDSLYSETNYIHNSVAVDLSEELSFVAKIGDKYGLISDGDKVILKCEFDSIFATSDDLVAVKKEGKMGIINKLNQWVIPNEYDAFLLSYDPYYLYLKKGGLTKGYLNVDSLKEHVYKADGVWGAYDIENREFCVPIKFSLKETMKKTSNYDYYQIP